MCVWVCVGVAVFFSLWLLVAMTSFVASRPHICVSGCIGLNMWECVCAYVYACEWVGGRVRVFVCVCVFVGVCVRMRVRACVHACVHVCVHMCVCTCVRAC